MKLYLNRLNWLLGSAAMVAPLAFAQPAPEADAEARQETVVVTGTPIRDSQTAAILEKRNAPNLVDVAAADAVGRFPDQNVAAALARLPAVAVQRDQGQERYVQVRGAPNRWVSVSVDGVSVIGVDEGGESRAFRFDAIPSVLLSSAAINKSLTSELSSEAVVANIDLRTYSPLSEQGFKLTGDIGGGTMELGQGRQEQWSLRGSWSNDRIGVVAGFSHYLREQTTDNREVGAYNSAGLPTELDARNYQLVRENNGAFVGVEFVATENLTVFAKGIVTEFVDDEQRDQYEFRLANAISGSQTTAGGDFVGVPVRGTFNLGEYRTEYEILTLGADWESDNWEMAYRLNATNTDNLTNLPLVQFNSSSSSNPSIAFDRTDPNFPRVRLFSTVPGTTPGTFVRGPALTSFNQGAVSSSVFIPILQDSFSESLTAKADITRKFENFSVTGGVEYTDRTLDGFTFAAVNALVLTSTVPQIGQTFTPANYVTSTPWSTNFPLGVTFNEIDNKRLRNDIEALLPALQARGLFDPSRNVPRTNFYDLGETLLAAYGQVAFEYGKADVVAGLRVERFERDSTGTVQSGTTFTPLTVTSEQTDLFPSLNVRYEVSDDVIFRVGVMRGLARPSFGQVRVGASINDTASPGTISGGNPTLEPEYTWGLDTSLEFYPNESSIFAVSAFNRWVDQVLYATTAPVGSAAFNSNNIDRSNYQLTSSFNGEDGQLFGVELNYLQQFDFLPGWASGFGFQGNVTFLDGDFDTRERAGIPFPGTSDTVVNASVFYEKYGFSGRVSYQYRSDWLDTLGGLGTGGLGDEIRKGYDNLDVTLRYALTDNLTLFADFANLTDAEYIVFQGIESRPTEVEQIGARYLAGLRFNF